jgi:hypothetical protein
MHTQDQLHGERLIFLISQPRAGSTLLQRMLGRHPDVYTVSETWLMLHPVYALRSEGYQAEYNEETARRALGTVLSALPAGEEEYIQGLRRMYWYLYSRLLYDRRERYLVDKTPRYYLIIRDLRRIFPEAKFVFLVRNPLAVLCSIVRTWVNDDWLRLGDLRLDLLRAPPLLVDGVRSLASHCLVLHYENLVVRPNDVVGKVCDFLGVRYSAAMVQYGLGEVPRWQLGDQDEVYRHDRPVAANVHRSLLFRQWVTPIRIWQGSWRSGDRPIVVFELLSRWSIYCADRMGVEASESVP